MQILQLCGFIYNLYQGFIIYVSFLHHKYSSKINKLIIKILNPIYIIAGTEKHLYNWIVQLKLYISIVEVFTSLNLYKLLNILPYIKHISTLFMC